jgi:hypothetical protein
MGSNDHGPGDPDLWARCRRLISGWRALAAYGEELNKPNVADTLKQCADELEKAMKR